MNEKKGKSKKPKKAEARLLTSQRILLLKVPLLQQLCSMVPLRKNNTAVIDVKIKLTRKTLFN